MADMTIKEFDAVCSRTSPPVDLDLVYRLGHFSDQLNDLMLRLIQISTEADQLKRKIFYNADSIETLDGLGQVEESSGIVNVARAVHGILGILGEFQEYVEENDGRFGINIPALKEEVPDQCWYIPELLKAGPFDMEELLEKVIEKLKIRYPEKYSHENALNRNIETEQELYK